MATLSLGKEDVDVTRLQQPPNRIENQSSEVFTQRQPSQERPTYRGVVGCAEARYVESGGHQTEKPGIQQFETLPKSEAGIIVKPMETGTRSYTGGTQLEFDTLQKSSLQREAPHGGNTLREQTVVGYPLDTVQRHQTGKYIR